ncbi:reverse transcriptase domain-containing protein [Nonomuraea fuscirosea]|uniref:reverse transcriptase domain-containing protein n=1 Tax=Nonomuraea fuscirosea TaxID=1291556 RepID=UPI003443A8B7
MASFSYTTILDAALGSGVKRHWIARAQGEQPTAYGPESLTGSGPTDALRTRSERPSIWPGAPQGGILSPLLADMALTALDELAGQGNRRLIRYCDDFVVMVSGPAERAEMLREQIEEVLARLGLRLSRDAWQRIPRRLLRKHWIPRSLLRRFCDQGWGSAE